MTQAWLLGRQKAQSSSTTTSRRDVAMPMRTRSQPRNQVELRGDIIHDGDWYWPYRQQVVAGSFNQAAVAMKPADSAAHDGGENEAEMPKRGVFI